MKKMMTKTTFAILLPLISTSAMAGTALQELKSQAGEDAVAAAALALPAQTSILPAPAVTPETTQKIQTVFQSLKGKNFPGIEWNGMILGIRFVRVPLQLATCPGCVSYTALLPVGALTPSAPVGDPNKAGYFILERSGEWINPQTRFSSAIRMPVKDVFAGCQAVDAKAFSMVAWTLPQAVGVMQSCLDKTYNQHPFARRIYFVTAQASRFSVRACPVTAAAFSCQAIMLVDGVQIKVSGRHSSEDTVADDLAYSIQKRGGMLLGYHAILSDESSVLHPEM